MSNEKKYNLKGKYSFRLNEEKDIKFHESMEKANVKTITEFILKSIENTEIIVKDESLEKERIKLFYKVSNNLNQALRALHIDRKSVEISDEIYEKLLKELDYLKQISFMILKKS